jgi:phosphatidate cytidylyltransferase
MLKKRIITSVWGIPLLAVIVWLGEPCFTIFVAVWGLLAILEFYRLANLVKATPQIALGIVWTLLFIAARNDALLDLLNIPLKPDAIIPALLTAGTVISLICLLARKQKLGAFPGWGWMVAGVIYIGWLLGFIVALRGLGDSRAALTQLDYGGKWVFFALLTTFGSDTTSFFVGRAIGKRKLAPSISPGKTWAGAIGGLFGAVAVGLLFLLNHPLSLASQLNWWQAVILGLLVSIFGQLGDLVESLLKRNTGVKDSGTLIPGHGGVLDRMDSVVFAVVVVYYWVICTTL